MVTIVDNMEQASFKVMNTLHSMVHSIEQKIWYIIFLTSITLDFKMFAS